MSAIKTAVQGAVMAVMKTAIEHAPDAWMPGGKPDPLIARKHGLIGQPVSRLDGPLKVQGKGIDWQWMDPAGNNSTDPSCPGARQLPFVVGFAPAYAPCAPPQALPEEGQAQPVEGEERHGGGWRSWFGLDKKKETPPADAASTPPAH